MKIETLAFLCRACKKVAEKDIKLKKGFELVAFEDIMDWSDFTQEVPDISTKIWERSSKTPSEGALRKVQVYFPFNMSVGEQFWTLYMPALSHFNGWDEYPEEIDSSAIINCSFESIISKNEEKAWINVKIESFTLRRYL